MKIGIFGDSFADYPRDRAHRTLGTTAQWRNLKLSWPEIIKSKYDTECHAESGTSLLYSIKKLKSLHEQYDRIILTVTCPGRFEFNKIIQNICHNLGDRYRDYVKMQNVTTCEFKMAELEKDTTPSASILREAVKAAYDYFLYIRETETDHYFQSLMLEDIKKLRPDTILIPAFEDSFPQAYGSCMFDIQCMEDRHWGISHPYDRNLGEDARICHMTAENNEIFAGKVEEWLSGQPVYINLNDFIKPKDPIEKYFFKVDED